MSESAPIVSQETIAKSPAEQSVDAKTRREFGEAGKRGQNEIADAAPAAPPPPAMSAPAATEPANRDKQEEQMKTKAVGKDDTDELPVNGRTAGGLIAKQAERSEDRVSVAGAATTTRSNQNQARRKPSLAAKNDPANNTATEKERAPETRSVGGRHFQRQGGAWVDTAYNSSRPTTNVARGSEQYRALVADEPGLRTIAEQLGGEVFVVWKSRAYRFH
jgi:hypothetical protein